MDKIKYKVGDLVDLRKYDQSERPEKRLGICRVVAVRGGQHSESGWMVTVEAENGRTLTLDPGWLHPASGQS